MSKPLISACEVFQHCWSTWMFTVGNRRKCHWTAPGLGKTSLSLLPPFSPHQNAHPIIQLSISPVPLLLSWGPQTQTHLIGIILGPVSLRIVNLAAHESGWLDKGDFIPVALSCQTEPWCCSPQERVCFQFLMGACFCSLQTSAKSNWQQKSPQLLQGKLTISTLYSWQVKMSSVYRQWPVNFLWDPCADSGEWPFFCTPLWTVGKKEVVCGERTEYGLVKSMRLDRQDVSLCCVL